MRSISCFILVFALFMPACHMGQATREPRLDQVAEFVKEYCKRESDGERDFRVIHSKWDHDVLQRMQQYNDMEPGYFNVLNDPIVVISKFEIKSITNTWNDKSVTISYHCLARTDGHGMDRTLVFQNDDQEETLHWSFSGGLFYLHNQSVPKISLSAVIREYEESYADMYSLNGDQTLYTFPKDWPKSSPASKYAAKNIDDLITLKRLAR